MTTKIKTQSELDKQIKAGKSEFEFVAAGTFEVNCKDRTISVSVGLSLKWDILIKAWGSSSVVAWGSSSVEARESSRVEARESSRVEARESSRVEAWGSSSVVAWGSSSVVARGSSSVVAWGSSSVEARGSSSVEAWGSSSVVAWGSSSVVARESSRVEARESSRVEAWGSSSVEAWGSSSVVAWGSSSVVARESSRVEARESSRVEAWGSSSVVAWGSSSVVAAGFVSLSLWGSVTARQSIKCHAFIHSKKVKTKGGQKTDAFIETPKDWCEYYGVKVERGIATLYKTVKADYYNAHNHTIQYVPGSMPEAPDWDDGKAECGGGLHFSPHPKMAMDFYKADDMHILACPVKLSEMAIHPDGSMPQKCKAKRVCKPCWEVNQDGEKI